MRRTGKWGEGYRMKIMLKIAKIIIIMMAITRNRGGKEGKDKQDDEE